MFHVPFLRLLFLQWHHVRKHMSVTVMRHICFIECPYHKSTPPTGKLAMPNFPHYQNKKTRNKTEPKTTVHHQHYFQQTSILQLSSSSTFPKPWHLGEDNGSIRLTEGTVVQTRLLAPWKLLFSVSGFTRPFRWTRKPVQVKVCFRKPFRFRLPVPGRFRKTCFIFLITKGKRGIVISGPFDSFCVWASQENWKSVIFWKAVGGHYGLSFRKS